MPTSRGRGLGSLAARRLGREPRNPVRVKPPASSALNSASSPYPTSTWPGSRPGVLPTATASPTTICSAPHTRACAKQPWVLTPPSATAPSSYVVPKVKGELLHHLRDTGFLLRITHRMRELWMKARRPVALGLADGEIAAVLGIELPEWLEVRQACGLRPVPLEAEGE
jgi:hypothetical protein